MTTVKQNAYFIRLLFPWSVILAQNSSKIVDLFKICEHKMPNWRGQEQKMRVSTPGLIPTETYHTPHAPNEYIIKLKTSSVP